jgi:hypothetical protein
MPRDHQPLDSSALLKSSTFEANSARLEHVGSARPVSPSSDFREERLARFTQCVANVNPSMETIVKLHPEGWIVFRRHAGTQNWIKQEVLSSRREALAVAERLLNVGGKELASTLPFAGVPILKR